MRNDFYTLNNYESNAESVVMSSLALLRPQGGFMMLESRKRRSVSGVEMQLEHSRIAELIGLEEIRPFKRRRLNELESDSDDDIVQIVSGNQRNSNSMFHFMESLGVDSLLQRPDQRYLIPPRRQDNSNHNHQ